MSWKKRCRYLSFPQGGQKKAVFWAYGYWKPMVFAHCLLPFSLLGRARNNADSLVVCCTWSARHTTISDSSDTHGIALASHIQTSHYQTSSGGWLSSPLLKFIWCQSGHWLRRTLRLKSRWIWCREVGHSGSLAIDHWEGSCHCGGSACLRPAAVSEGREHPRPKEGLSIVPSAGGRGCCGNGGPRCYQHHALLWSNPGRMFWMFLTQLSEFVDNDNKVWK